MPVLSTLGAAIANVYGFTSGLIKDQYFNLVSLLLPGNGTNGKQNNAFVDSSSNNFFITPNGDVTQGTFSPFSQTGWGAYFNASNYLTATLTGQTPGTGSVTYECWVYPTNLSTTRYVFNTRPISDTQTGILCQITSTGALQVTYSNLALFSGSANNIVVNQWQHIALVRNGSTNWTAYVNGTSIGTFSNSVNLSSDYLSIGSLWTSATFLGYISNLRIVNGVVVPPAGGPTSPLTAVSGTSILTLQSNRFKDNSTNNFTITSNGSVAVTPFSPFAPTSSYSAAAVGGSGYFDGSGDWLSLADSEAFNFGNGDFTIEMWTYLTGTSTANAYRMTGQCSSAVFDSDLSFSMLKEDTTDKYLSYVRSGSTNYETRSSQSATRNAWVHIALVRSGGNLNQYINGQLDGQSTALSTNTINNSTKQLSIGRQGELAAGYYEGNIANYRIVKGTAVYTGNFTPPTKPLAASGADSAGSYPSTTNVNTSFASSACSLLLNFTNAGVIDATAKNVLETEGNAQISTAQSKWGGGSIAFNGSTDYLLVRPDAPLPLYIRTGDFTIEAWIYITTTATANYILWGNNGPDIQFYVTTGAKLACVIGAVGGPTGSTSIATNTWTYVAARRTGGTISVYVNGNLDGSSATGGSSDLNNSKYYIGTNTSSYFSGYIDDFRFTRYARTITLPTAPFPVQ